MTLEQLTHLKIIERPQGFGLRLAFDAFMLDAEARRLTKKTLLYYKQQLTPRIV
jgi:hypothetical protein